MPTQGELIALLSMTENERLERKESANDSGTFSENVCALANDLNGSNEPGYLVYGVDDDGGRVGIRFDDDLQTRIVDWARSGNILPTPVIRIHHVNDGTLDFAVLEITPSMLPPVRYRGRVWVRVGPTTRVAQPHEEQLLVERRRALATSADLMPVVQAGIADLDLDFFRSTYLPQAVSVDTLERNQRTEIQQLQSLRILNPEGIPTVAGTLLLAIDPRQFIPGAYIQFRRIEGRELQDHTLDAREISGPLNQMLSEARVTIRTNIQTEYIVDESGQDTRRSNYPESALMQLLINAVLHRSYENTFSPVRINWFSDRIEIDNPGGPFGQVTAQNFGTGVTDYRNPALAEMLKNLNWVQRFGLGIQEARAALRENGNPLPQFTPEATRTLVIIEARQ